MNFLRFFLYFIITFIALAAFEWGLSDSKMDPEGFYLGTLPMSLILPYLLFYYISKINYELQFNEKDEFIEKLDKYINENFTMLKENLSEGIIYRSRLRILNNFKVRFLNGKAILSGSYYGIMKIRNEVFGEKNLMRRQYIMSSAIIVILIFLWIVAPMTNTYKRYFCNMGSYPNCLKLGEILFRSEKKQEGLIYLKRACDNDYNEACTKLDELTLKEGNKEEWRK